MASGMRRRPTLLSGRQLRRLHGSGRQGLVPRAAGSRRGGAGQRARLRQPQLKLLGNRCCERAAMRSRQTSLGSWAESRRQAGRCRAAHTLRALLKQAGRQGDEQSVAGKSAAAGQRSAAQPAARRRADMPYTRCHAAVMSDTRIMTLRQDICFSGCVFGCEIVCRAFSQSILH